MIEQPLRVASLMASWVADGDAKRAIFNLKLPMKKRFEELRKCEERMAEILESGQRHFELRMKQLYHDREEVTCFLTTID